MKKTKKILEAVPWSYRFLIILGLLFVSVTLTSYSIYKKIPNVDTKQEIRIFLKSIDPNILQMIDAGKKEIHIFISKPKIMKLFDLYTYPDFNKFLSFQRSGDTNVEGNQKDDFINELPPPGDISPLYAYLEGYYLFPKPPLIDKF
ncbi:MAG: hypothetical protein ABSG82_09525 [Sedimentisphaerales bacterium]